MAKNSRFEKIYSQGTMTVTDPVARQGRPARHLARRKSVQRVNA